MVNNGMIWDLPSGYVNSLLLKMAIEIVDFPMKHGDFPVFCKRLPEGKTPKNKLFGSTLRTCWWLLSKYPICHSNTSYVYVINPHDLPIENSNC